MNELYSARVQLALGTKPSEANCKNNSGLIESALAKFDFDFGKSANLSLAFLYKSDDPEKSQVKFYQAPYRGNCAYEQRVLRKLDEVKRALYWAGQQKYLDLELVENKTRCLHLILEFDSNRFSLDESWLLASLEINRFLTAFKKRYGSILYILKNESHLSGYPHLHLFIYCYEHQFDTFWQKKRNKKHKLLIKQAKKNTYNQDDLPIESLWLNGFVRVEGCTNLMSGINYLAKSYFGKSLDYRAMCGDPHSEQNKKGIMTLALTHYFRKNMFSYSHNVNALVELYLNENNAMHSSNSISSQTENIRFLGLVRFKIQMPGEFYECSYQEFLVEKNNPDDPIFEVLYSNYGLDYCTASLNDLIAQDERLCGDY